MNDGWSRRVRGKRRRPQSRIERWQASPPGHSVLISVCNKESEMSGPGEDLVHLVSALTRNRV